MVSGARACHEVLDQRGATKKEGLFPSYCNFTPKYLSTVSRQPRSTATEIASEKTANENVEHRMHGVPASLE
jgi:hypothetical protein